TLLSYERLLAFYRSGYWQDQTIYGLAKAHADRTPERFALRDSARRYTYGELLAAVDAFATDLSGRGVRPGDRVAVWLPSRVETAVALLACSRNGFVCCPSLHRDHTVSNVVDLLERTRAVALLTQPGYGADGHRRDVKAAIERLPALRHLFTLAPGTSLIGLTATGDSPVSPDPNRVVYLAFTSGTTGEPKGVMHSDNTLLSNALALGADWNIGASSVVYSLSPLSHNLGLGSLIMALSAGAEFVIHDLAKSASLVDRVLETETTFLVGVPTHAYDLLKELRERGMPSLGRVKGFRISGAAASKDVVAGLLELGIMPQAGYGMTEAGSHNYTLPGDDPRFVLETSGRACRGYEIRIWDQDNPDLEVPAGTVGQIGGRGASLMLGYFDAQATTEQAFNSAGWFMTGDVGWLDEHGYLHVTGRKKDLIIRGGHNIYPAAIEALAMRHEAVERAVAMPVPDERLGEKVCIAVMLRPGRALTSEELLAHLDTEGLSKYEMPEYYLALSEIPLTPSGKIRKIDLVERIRTRSLIPTPIRWEEKASAK
ncbi:MAG TPA: class I adenylate-forming enzyme family protein, partial [Candidatus Acidoferrales bacterium]|nr:class I adenylate-forming enzyme family protein [Candidatus Acidoferrales bacterium]